MLADPTTAWAALREPRRRQAPLTDLRTLGRFDNVFCRNVLIDFGQPTRARVLNAIARLLPADGLLYLGGATTVLRITSRRVRYLGNAASTDWPRPPQRWPERSFIAGADVPQGRRTSHQQQPGGNAKRGARAAGQRARAGNQCAVQRHAEHAAGLPRRVQRAGRNA